MQTNSDTTKALYIGLDVHKEQTVIAILEGERDAEPRLYGSVATAQHALERAIRRIARQQRRRLADLHVCYEASGCGFWIARRLLQMGVRCDVIAPSLIPTRSGDRVVEVHTSATGGAAPILVEGCRHPPNSTRSG